MSMNNLIRYILVMIIACGVISVDGQVRLGVKAGLTVPFSKNKLIQYDDFQDFLAYEVTVLQQNVSPEVGIVAFYSNNLLFLQTEALFKRAETEFIIESFIQDDTRLPRESKLTSYLTLPITAGVMINGTYKLGIGPVFSVILDDTTILNDVEYFEERQSKVEKGFSFSFGILVKRLHFDMRYETRFDGIAEDFYFRDARQGFKQRPGYLSFGVGLVL